MDERATSAHVAQFMVMLADHIKPKFPHYCVALCSEINGNKMTNGRWNSIAAILSSLAALPGTCFEQSEHDARNPALRAVAVAQKMAAATFGGRNDVGQCLEFAVFMSDEIRDSIERNK